MGNNFNRGKQNGKSVDFRDNTGDVWVATSEPSDSRSMTDGSRYVRTVILARNTFGLGSSNDKTAIGVDPPPATCLPRGSSSTAGAATRSNLSRSTDHGATFSIPMKISSGLCSNQGPNFAFGPSGQVYLVWAGNKRGSQLDYASSH
jgi:hypothetical protein